jgi:2-methylcitrate dehydratase PrpD
MGVALKFYSCVGSNHTTLDALREMQTRRPFSARDVKKIVVHASQVTVDHAGWKYRPESLASAQMNLAFCAATFLLEGDCFVDQFSDAVVADSRRMALAEKVEVRPDPGISARGAKYRHSVRVEVMLNDGSLLERSVETPRGSDPNFASETQIVAKFEKLAAHALKRSQTAQLRDAVLGMEKLRDAARLAQWMTPKGKK